MLSKDTHGAGFTERETRKTDRVIERTPSGEAWANDLPHREDILRDEFSDGVLEANTQEKERSRVLKSMAKERNREGGQRRGAPLHG